jgi:hypothetical protein
MNIKMGGCYKTEEGYLIVGVKKDNAYQCQDIIIDSSGYDEEICDLTTEEIEKIADLSICYRPYYHKRFGLYKVWDETKPRENEIILQKNI